MKQLFFLRHGIAVLHGTPGYPNDDRPLTDEGIEKMAKAAKGIKRIVEQFDVILTSPMKRAFQTACLVAREMKCEGSVETARELAPGCTRKGLMALLTKHKEHEVILLVGHDPDFSSLTSELIGAADSAVVMKKGALCKIELNDASAAEPGRLEWLLQPKTLRLLAKK